MSISVLDDIITKAKAVVAAMEIVPTVPLFKHVYEKGESRDRTQLPYAVLHFGEEKVPVHPDGVDQLEVPLIVEVEFPRPNVAYPPSPLNVPLMTPGQFGRLILARLQVVFKTNEYLDGKCFGGVTYDGDGSTIYPIDQEADAAFAFAITPKWKVPYQHRLDDPTLTT